MDPDNLLESMKKDWKNVEPVLYLLMTAASLAGGIAPVMATANAKEVVKIFRKTYIKDKEAK